MICRKILNKPVKDAPSNWKHSCLGNVWDEQTEKIKKDLLKGLDHDKTLFQRLHLKKDFHKMEWDKLPLTLKKKLTSCEIEEMA